MLFYSHTLFATFFYLIDLYIHHKHFTINITNIKNFIITIIFSFLPDIDSNKSKLGKKLPIISWILRHRGILHSIYPAILLGLFNYYAMLGYISHLVADSLTKKGIRPFHTKFRIRGFIETGSLLEQILDVILLIILILLSKAI